MQEQRSGRQVRRMLPAWLELPSPLGALAMAVWKAGRHRGGQGQTALCATPVPVKWSRDRDGQPGRCVEVNICLLPAYLPFVHLPSASIDGIATPAGPLALRYLQNVELATNLLPTLP
eukprot:2118577-Pleurochrysis_carterae.AAC.5